MTKNPPVRYRRWRHSGAQIHEVETLRYPDTGGGDTQVSRYRRWRHSGTLIQEVETHRYPDRGGGDTQVLPIAHFFTRSGRF